MSINWDGAQLDISAMVILAAIAFVLNAASTIVDNLFWTKGIRNRITNIRELKVLSGTGVISEKIYESYRAEASDWIEKHATKRNFASMIIGSLVRGSLALYIALFLGAFQLFTQINNGVAVTTLLNNAIAYIIISFAIEGAFVTFRPLVKPLSKRNKL